MRGRTLPPRGKSAEIFQLIRGGRGIAATHPPRKNRLVPHEKNVPQFCLRFVSTPSHEVNVGSVAGVDNGMQVAHPPSDFARARVAAARAMAIKRLNRRWISSRSEMLACSRVASASSNAAFHPTGRAARLRNDARRRNPAASAATLPQDPCVRAQSRRHTT
jgi:hypothetical protein